MGIYEDLKAAIADVITTNGNNEITGAILNDVLQNIVSSFGEHATFAGIATPDVQPGTVDQNVFYLATIAGTYIYFDEIVVNSGEVAILTNKTGSWKKKFSGLATQEKLTELEKKVSNIIIDSEMSDTSENAVSNKVIKAYVDRVKGYIDDILGKNVTDAIDNINEILAFLSTISDKDTLAGIFEELKQYIDNADNLIRQYIDNAIIALAAVAKSGSYNDLIDKPIIPAVVTESTISEWGFTKNTGTIKGVIMNGVLQKESDGNVNLGTVITDISGKQEKLISGTNIKTLNGISLLGSGNIQIGGSISRVEMTSEIASIKANEFYIWQMVNSLNITLISGSEKVMNRYIFQFRNPKETTTLLTLPDDITWSTDTELDDNGLPIMEASAFCRIEIIEGLATLKKWKLVYIQFADKEVERVLMSNGVGDGIGITKRDAAAVTSIGRWFRENADIEYFDELQFFTGLTSLSTGNVNNPGIFKNCLNLKSVIPPYNVTAIQKESFFGTPALSTVLSFPYLVTIGHRAFHNSGVIRVEDLGTIKELPDEANYNNWGVFSSCVNLTYVNIPSTLTIIGRYSFYGDESLDSLGNIDWGAITDIGKEAFALCSNLNVVINAPNLINLGQGAFRNSGVVRVENLGSVTEFLGRNNYNNWGDFYSCVNLEFFRFPATTTAIGAYSIRDCTGLQCVICDAEVPPTLGSGAFNNTNNCPIYVPDASVEAYKAATNWNSYSARILPMSEFGVVYENVAGNYTMDVGQAYGQAGGAINFTTDTAYEHTKVKVGDVDYVVVKAPSQASSLIQYVDGNDKILKLAVTNYPSSLTRYNIEDVAGATHIYLTSAAGTLQIWKKKES